MREFCPYFDKRKYWYVRLHAYWLSQAVVCNEKIRLELFCDDLYETNMEILIYMYIYIYNYLEQQQEEDAQLEQERRESKTTSCIKLKNGCKQQ